jgi:3'-5' exoribonuclease
VKQRFIADLQTHDELENEPFLLQDVVQRTTRDGRPYLLCTYSDRSGQASGVFWDVPEHVAAWIRPGLAVLVTGRVTEYRNAPQISTTDLNRWLQPEMSLFLPSSKRPRAEMESELLDYIDQLSSPWRELVADVLLTPEFYHRFLDAPAARGMHHAFVGGLLEHTLSMARLSLLLAGHYPYVNRDLLLAGALLHDAGKALEYELSNGISFSDDGRLVGHIIRVIAMVERSAVQHPELSEPDLRHLVHLLASHHGTHEWGSPVVPKTLEAILLHQIDLLDSRVQGFFDHLEADIGADSWSVRASHMFNTELRRPEGFGAGTPPATEVEDDAFGE